MNTIIYEKYEELIGLLTQIHTDMDRLNRDPSRQNVNKLLRDVDCYRNIYKECFGRNPNFTTRFENELTKEARTAIANY